MQLVRICAIAMAIAMASLPVGAHELILRYELPIPFRLYAFACAATLAVTFVVFGWFMRTPTGESRQPTSQGDHAVGSISPGWLRLLRALALACLGVTIVAGLVGTADPDTNLGPTLFWQVFLLGFVFLTAVIGDVFEFLNPWRTVVDRWISDKKPPLLTYPPAFGYWPAVLLYVAIAWTELFTQPHPRTIAVVLLGYSFVTWGGALVFGKVVWFRYGEVFSVLLRLVGALAPFYYRPLRKRGPMAIYVRPPFVGVLDEKVTRMSLVVFILSILSLTTYDGIHLTVLWMGLFWNYLLPLFHPLWNADLSSTQAGWERLFSGYQRLGLVLSPFLYLAIYWAFLWFTQRAARTSLSLRQLALSFSVSILPIAIAYSIAHNYTLILTRGYVLPYLFSDPLGRGWNPLKLAHMGDPPVLDMAQVWHSEVVLILLGHLISIYLAHRIALGLVETRRHAVLSQLPMLVLMVSYTVIGLWVISLPFALT